MGKKSSSKVPATMAPLVSGGCTLVAPTTWEFDKPKISTPDSKNAHLKKRNENIGELRVETSCSDESEADAYPIILKKIPQHHDIPRQSSTCGTHVTDETESLSAHSSDLKHHTVARCGPHTKDHNTDNISNRNSRSPISKPRGTDSSLLSVAKKRMKRLRPTTTKTTMVRSTTVLIEEKTISPASSASDSEDGSPEIAVEKEEPRPMAGDAGGGDDEMNKASHNDQDGDGSDNDRNDTAQQEESTENLSFFIFPNEAEEEQSVATQADDFFVQFSPAIDATPGAWRCVNSEAVTDKSDDCSLLYIPCVAVDQFTRNEKTSDSQSQSPTSGGSTTRRRNSIGAIGGGVSGFGNGGRRLSPSSPNSNVITTITRNGTGGVGLPRALSFRSRTPPANVGIKPVRRTASARNLPPMFPWRSPSEVEHKNKRMGSSRMLMKARSTLSPRLATRKGYTASSSDSVGDISTSSATTSSTPTTSLPPSGTPVTEVSKLSHISVDDSTGRICQPRQSFSRETIDPSDQEIEICSSDLGSGASPVHQEMLDLPSVFTWSISPDFESRKSNLMKETNEKNESRCEEKENMTKRAKSPKSFAPKMPRTRNRLSLPTPPIYFDPPPAGTPESAVVRRKGTSQCSTPRHQSPSPSGRLDDSPEVVSTSKSQKSQIEEKENMNKSSEFTKSPKSVAPKMPRTRNRLSLPTPPIFVDPPPAATSESAVVRRKTTNQCSTPRHLSPSPSGRLDDSPGVGSATGSTNSLSSARMRKRALEQRFAESVSRSRSIRSVASVE